MNEKTYVFGDLHFSLKNSKYKAATLFIEWFISLFSKANHKNDTIIFVGDIGDYSLNPGKVLALINTLFSFCSSTFKDVFIILGNHDVKLYTRANVYEYAHSLDFLTAFSNVHIIDKPTFANILNLRVLMLPYPKVSKEVFNYEAMDFEPHDLCIGHFATKVGNKLFGDVDTSLIPAKRFVLGHVHTHGSPYIGSIYPNAISEQEQKYYEVIEENDVHHYEPIPEVLRYKHVVFPDGVEPDKNIIYVLKPSVTYTEDDIAHVYGPQYQIENDKSKEETQITLSELSNLDEFFDAEKLISLVMDYLSQKGDIDEKLRFKIETHLRKSFERSL